MRRFRLLLPVLSLLALATLSSSCSESGPTAPSVETANFAPSLGVDLANSVKTSSGLYYRDIVVGSGAEVPANVATSLRVQYAGYFRSGVGFDSGTFDFTTGANQAIDGMDEGVRGMKVGGQRQLVIRPGLGYGSHAYGSIPANSILVFNVTLTNIF